VGVEAQRLFPVKIKNKWGLINVEGKLVKDPEYDAIGEFKHSGYAIMQRQGKVGLLDYGAREVVPPMYDDLKILDSALVSVKVGDSWRVQNLAGQEILPESSEDLKVLKGKRLAFLVEGKWGMTDYEGNVLAGTQYDKIETEDGQYFTTTLGSKVGLLSASGFVILPPVNDEIRVVHANLYFFRNEKIWGAVNRNGVRTISCQFEDFEMVGENFVKLSYNKNFLLYSIKTEEIITRAPFENFYPFAPHLAIVKSNRHLGLIDTCGTWHLPPKFNEIQRMGDRYFRVNFLGAWGVAGFGGTEVLPFSYDYISPLREKFAFVKKNNLFGLCNASGELVVPIEFSKIEISGNSAKAYRGEELSYFDFDEAGHLLDKTEFAEHFTIVIQNKNSSEQQRLARLMETEFVLDNYEWFYSPVNDRWGLRRLEDGNTQIEPVFDVVRVQHDLGISLVGINKPQRYTFDRTTYRFEMVYGMVRNSTSELITPMNLWDIRLSDFRKGYPVARCLFETGKFGLLLRTGTVIVSDCAYIGEYEEGLARMSQRGKISGRTQAAPYGLGNLSEFLEHLSTPVVMLNYTAFDQEFNRSAELTCEGCLWGFLDTLGRMPLSPEFAFAKNFENEVGIVEKNQKWGAVSSTGRQLIPFEFDEIEFLEQSDKKVIRVYKREERYGMIDTTGQIRIAATYDDIGSLSEGKLAVKRNNVWGFVNRNGQEVVPCRFQRVENFSEGLAAVKTGNSWSYIDNQGEVVIKGDFIRVGNFHDGLAWVVTKNGSGYIDRTGSLVIADKFQRAFDFQFGVARVVEDGKFGLLSKDGSMRLSPKYPDIGPFNEFGLAVVRFGGENIRYGLLNIRGELVTRQEFREIRPFKEGMAAVRFKDAYGFINLTGDLVVEAAFTKVADFAEGLAAVQQAGNCGYIRPDGSWMQEPQFSKCLDFRDGRAIVYRGSKNAGLIDSTGRMLIEPKINQLLQFTEGRGLVRDSSYRFFYITEEADPQEGYFQRATEFRHGVAVIQMDNKWGIINQKGVEIIPPKYDKISQFENGFAKVRIKGFSGLTTVKGEAIVQPDYEYINYAGEGLYRVEQGDKVGYFDSEGNWIWQLDK
jgi:hypothetical protein